MQKARLLYSLLIGLALISFSCEKKEPGELPACLSQFGEFIPDNEPRDGIAAFEFYADAKLVITDQEDWFSFEKVSGDHLVFKYEFVYDDAPDIIDDEYSEVVWFEVNPEGDSFEIDLSDFEQYKGLYGRLCFCVDGGWHKISDGCIYGKKIKDNTWNISMAIQLATNLQTYTRMIQSDFVRID